MAATRLLSEVAQTDSNYPDLTYVCLLNGSTVYVVVEFDGGFTRILLV